MKSFLIIGSGTFGHHLCRSFSKLKCEIMLVDRKEEAMNDLLSVVTSARIADCTNQEALESLDIPSFDACFVCVGASFQHSLEITWLLKELGAKKVLSRASDDVQAKFLLRNGADDVIFPEHEIAERIAVSESSDSIFDCIPLTKDYGIYELSVRPEWVGKTILDLHFRTAYDLTILATKTNGNLKPMPSMDYKFRAEDHIIVIGSSKAVNKVL